MPFAWVFFAASRFPSRWIAGGQSAATIETMTDGSPPDRLVFAALIGLAILILSRRRVDVAGWLRTNPWVFVLFLYAALSVIWSDHPSVAFKRLLKSFGNVLMVVLILTEDNPRNALGWIMRRLAYIILPLSVLYIKYFPDLGRTYHMGEPLYNGVTNQKNELGQTCMLLSLYFAWATLYLPKGRTKPFQRPGVIVYAAVVPMLAWLLYMSDSATSQIGVLLGMGLLVVAKANVLRGRMRTLVGAVGVGSLLLAFLISVMDVHILVIQAAGRDTSLTTRVPMWFTLLSMPDDTLLGAGFHSYWLEPRASRLYTMFAVSNAHNGYLDVYLNLGIIGLAILAAVMVAGLGRLRSEHHSTYAFNVFRIVCVVVIAVYNWTESAFLFGVSDIWMLFLIGVVSRPRHARSVSSSTFVNR